MWNGNNSFEMKAINDSLELPEKINVTTVFYQPNTNQVIISTKLEVPTGSDFTFKGTKSIDLNTAKTASFTFQNTPSHKEYIMSSKWASRTNSSSMPQPFSFSFPDCPSDLFLQLKTVDFGVKYAWFDYVLDGVRYEDLSDMKQTQSHEITLPGPSSGIKMRLHAFPDSGNHYTGAYRIDLISNYQDIFETVMLNYPPNEFPDFRTSLTFYNDFDYSDSWEEITYGDFPSVFTKINADFDIVNSSINNFEITAIGEYSESVSQWLDESNNVWEISGAQGNTSYQLPLLSPAIIQLFSVDRSQFKLQSVELIHYPEIESYSDLLDKKFNATNHFFDIISKSRIRSKISSNQ